MDNRGGQSRSDQHPGRLLSEINPCFADGPQRPNSPRRHAAHPISRPSSAIYLAALSGNANNAVHLTPCMTFGLTIHKQGYLFALFTRADQAL